MTSTTATQYGVARGKKLISGGFPAPESARTELANLEQGMRDVGLDPDVRLVEYDVTTTVETSAPRAYQEPEPEVEETETPVDPSTPA